MQTSVLLVAAGEGSKQRLVSYRTDSPSPAKSERILSNHTFASYVERARGFRLAANVPILGVLQILFAALDVNGFHTLSADRIK